MAQLLIRLLLLCTIVTLLTITGGQSLLTSEEIAYVSSTRNIRHLHLLDVQRKLLRQLSPLRLLECCLAWSPDGESLAVVSDISETTAWEIHTMSNLGQNELRLTQAVGIDSLPTWSPDGKQLAFISSRNNEAEIFIANADGTGQRPIQALNLPVRITWAHGGRQIEYVAVIDRVPGIYTSDVTCGRECPGSIQHVLDPLLFLDPADTFVNIPGSGLVLASFNRSPSGGYGIYVVPEDTNRPPERLTFNSDLNPPSIAGNGQLVAFISGELDAQAVPRQKHVYVLDPDCIGTAAGCRSRLRRVADAVGVDRGLSLSSDGVWLAFVATWSGSSEIYRVRTDGTGLERLTWNDTVELLPAWRP